MENRKISNLGIKQPKLKIVETQKKKQLSRKELKSLSNEEIKIISKNWHRDDWEAYLSNLEGHFEEELLLDQPCHIEEYSLEDGLGSIFSYIHEEHPNNKERMERAVRRILREQLSPREYQVTWLQFWGGLSQRKIAERLEISRMSVRVLQDRAQAKIKSAIFLKSIKNSRVLCDL